MHIIEQQLRSKAISEIMADAEEGIDQNGHIVSDDSLAAEAEKSFDILCTHSVAAMAKGTPHSVIENALTIQGLSPETAAALLAALASL